MNDPEHLPFQPFASPRTQVMLLLLGATLPALLVLLYFWFWPPLTGADPAFRSGIHLMLAGMAAITALVLATGWLVCNRLFLGPLQPVLNTLRKVASGDLSARTRADAPVGESARAAAQVSETSRLAYEVDRMAEALSSRDKALTEARDRAQAYLDIVGVMVLALNAKGSIVLANRKASEVLECSQLCKSANSNWFEKWIPLAQRESARAQFEGQMAGAPLGAEGGAGGEGQIITASGKLRLIAWHVSPLTDQSGRPIGLLLAGEDISEARQTQMALLDSRNRYRALVENIPGVVFRCEVKPPWRMEFISPLVEKLTGIPAAHFLNHSVRFGDLIHPEDRPKVEQAVYECIRDQRPYTCEYRIRRLTGAWRQVNEQGQAICDSTGRPVWLDGVVLDITRNKLLQEEQERLQAQLQQAQKMEALGQLTGGIAHDFNNILAAVLGFAKLALRRHGQDATGEVAEYLREVITAGERARDLVARMLAFSRAQPGLAPQSLAPLPMVKEAVKLLSATIPASIRIDSRYDDNLPDIAIDPTALHQIMMNLVINARDALDGKGLISIILTRRVAALDACQICPESFSDDWLELSVCDDGPGIAPEIAPHIFEPFFTTKEIGRGTGMGLAMVHGLVHRAGGHIQLETQPGLGTCFRIFLPVAASDRAPSAIPPASLPEASGRNRHVLVVDDEPTILRLLHATLQEAGWQASCFTSPRQALAVFRDAPDLFDALICDQSMPDMTGIELVQALHALRPHLHAILCTGFSDGLDAAAAQALGFRHFFLKPVDAELLLAALTSAGIAHGPAMPAEHPTGCSSGDR